MGYCSAVFYMVCAISRYYTLVLYGYVIILFNLCVSATDMRCTVVPREEGLTVTSCDRTVIGSISLVEL
uniref:Uncharacterized protein n=1 Tax=Arundo donax TaxID=35708 RepID=A0A0A9H226_ARUDO